MCVNVCVSECMWVSVSVAVGILTTSSSGSGPAYGRMGPSWYGVY